MAAHRSSSNTYVQECQNSSTQVQECGRTASRKIGRRFAARENWPANAGHPVLRTLAFVSLSIQAFSFVSPLRSALQLQAAFGGVCTGPLLSGGWQAAPGATMEHKAGGGGEADRPMPSPPLGQQRQGQLPPPPHQFAVDMFSMVEGLGSPPPPRQHQSTALIVCPVWNPKPYVDVLLTNPPSTSSRRECWASC